MNRDGFKTRTASPHRRALMRMLALTIKQAGFLNCTQIVGCCAAEGLTSEEATDMVGDLFTAGAYVQHEDPTSVHFNCRMGDADAIGRVKAGMDTIWSRAAARSAVSPADLPRVKEIVIERRNKR